MNLGELSFIKILNLMQIRWSTRSITMNAMVTRYITLLNNVLPLIGIVFSHMHSKVSFKLLLSCYQDWAIHFQDTQNAWLLSR